MEHKSKIEWINLIRALAIMFVVLCHCTEGIYRFNTESMASADPLSKVFGFTAFSTGRLGVPFFLMISGYLLLDRAYDTEKARHFWKNNWFHLLLCTYIWIIIYNLFDTFFNQVPFSITSLLKEMLFLKSSSMNHMWYMPMLLGTYLLIPYVANGIRSIQFQTTLFPIAIFVLFAFGHPCLNTIRNIVGKIPFPLTFSMGFSGGVYGLYFIIGYFLKKGLLKKINTWIIITMDVLLFGLTVLFQLWAYSKGYTYNVWYDNLFLLVSSVGLFELFSRIKHIPFYNMICLISRYSFGIYLIHNIAKSLTIPWISALNLSRPLKVIILWVILFISSIDASWLICRIPKIGKYITYTK